MKYFNIIIFFEFLGIVFAGGSSICEPFVSDFHAFENVWINFVNNIQKYVVDSANSYPILTPGFVEDWKCESNVALSLAANAISSLSGVDSNLILDILNSTASPPYETPLDCIADDLIYMRNHIHSFSSAVIPQLIAAQVIAPNPGNNCFQIYANLVGYLAPAFSLTTTKGGYMSSDNKAFAAINMEDLFHQSYVSAMDCTWDVIGAGLGAVFNEDASAVVEYTKGNSKDLPYPFSCIQPIIDSCKIIAIQTQNSFISGQKLDISFPTIPNFSG